VIAGPPMIVIEAVTAFVAPLTSVAPVVKENVPALVGVPVIAPETASSASPGGSIPSPGTVKYLKGGAPPATTSDCLYAAPASPGANLGETTGAGYTVIEKLRWITSAARKAPEKVASWIGKYEAAT
jgi:hypothetical protein